MASKISVYSIPDLKNTTDDALPTYLLSLPLPSTSKATSPQKAFTVSHTHTDIRLSLSLSAVLLAAVTFYLDYRYGFIETRTYTLYAVIVYFALNSALTYWIWAVEAGCIFAGRSNVTGETLRIASHAPTGGKGKWEPKYCLTVTTEGKEGVRTVRKVEGEYRRWFDEEGRFVTQAFQEWLAGAVEVVRRADPGRVSVGKKGR